MKLIAVMTMLFVASQAETQCGNLFNDLSSHLGVIFQKAKTDGEMMDGKLLVGNLLVPVQFSGVKWCGTCLMGVADCDDDDPCKHFRKLLAKYDLVYKQKATLGDSKHERRGWGGYVLGNEDAKCNSGYVDNAYVA